MLQYTTVELSNSAGANLDQLNKIPLWNPAPAHRPTGFWKPAAAAARFLKPAPSTRRVWSPQKSSRPNVRTEAAFRTEARDTFQGIQRNQRLTVFFSHS
jgi:hypothetical protein